MYKTNGPVNCVRGGEEKKIYGIVGRNTFYEIDRGSNKIVRCIKFKKHSITNFYCAE